MKELLLAAALALGCALSWPAQAQIPGGGCNPATSTQIGCSRPDNSTITINNGVLSTTAGGGNVNGPASSTVGFIPQWNNTSGTLLGAGLPVGTTGNSTVIETSAGGLLSATILPIATTGAFGAVKPDGTTITISAGVISAVGGGAVSLTAGNAGIVLSPSTITGTGTISLGNPSASTLGGIESFASVAHQWINAISTSGVPSATQPAFSDLSGSATLAQLPSLNADTFYCNPTGSGAAPQDCGLGSGLVFAGTNLDPAAPVTPHTATGNISTLAGLDIFNCTAACTATLATMAANQSLMVSTYNGTNSPTLSMNGQTLVGCPSTDATTIHQFGFYVFAFDATNTQVDGACFPGFGTITTNVLPKFLDGTGALGASGLSDNGTVVSTTEPIDLTSQPLAIEVANASSTGTTVNKLAKLTGAPATAVLAATTDTDNMVGIVSGGAGTTGNAQIAISGQVSCVFDGATTAGDYVVISSSTPGDCHDFGASAPSATQIIGRVTTTNGSAGTFNVALGIGFRPSGGTGCTVSGSAGLLFNNGSNGCITDTDVTFATHTITFGASAITDFSAVSVTAGFKLASAAGAAPTSDSFFAFDTTAHDVVWGSNGTTAKGAALNLNQTWTAGQAVTPDTATSCGTQSAGGTMTPDFSKSNSCQATFGAGNLTIANPINIKAGQTYIIALTQDGTGSRTVTWGSDFKWPGATAPTLSTGANDRDEISCNAFSTSALDCVLAGLNFH